MAESPPVDRLRKSFSGQVLVSGDPGYAETCVVFNAMIERRPAVIARCGTAADVATAVTFARKEGLEVAVRSGGHSVVGYGICDDGLLVDLAGLKGVEVDPTAKVARTGGGVLWGEFDAATQAHALHTPGGRVTTTGVGGFTTGGGYGWTSSKHGLACDNLEAAEVVLADGSVVTASQDEHADLFWGIRGGGGNFGIVTRFDFRLHPLGPIVLAGLTMWPLAEAPEVLRAWRDYVDGAPDELGTGAVILTAPPEEFVPDHLKGQPAVGIAAIYVGDPEEGASVIQPIKDLDPTVDLIQPMPYTVFQSLLDPTAPPGMRSYWRGEYFESLSDSAIDLVLSKGPELVRAGFPLTQTVLFRIGQAVNAMPEDGTAFSHRDANYLFHPITVWNDPGDDDRLMGASRDYAEAMRALGTGAAYLNFSPEDRVRDAFGDEKHERLVALKDRYDPENVFRLNQNIQPSRGQPVSA